MTEHGDESAQHPPRWVPYTPPSPDGWDRVRFLLRRLSFPFALFLLGMGVAGVFYWNTQMEAKTYSTPTANLLPSSNWRMSRESVPLPNRPSSSSAPFRPAPPCA
jgi:hypothetical protein